MLINKKGDFMTKITAKLTEEKKLLSLSLFVSLILLNIHTPNRLSKKTFAIIQKYSTADLKALIFEIKSINKKNQNPYITYYKTHKLLIWAVKDLGLLFSGESVFRKQLIYFFWMWNYFIKGIFCKTKDIKAKVASRLEDILVPDKVKYSIAYDYSKKELIDLIFWMNQVEIGYIHIFKKYCKEPKKLIDKLHCAVLVLGK